MTRARAIMAPPCPCDTSPSEMIGSSWVWNGEIFFYVLKCSQINFRKSQEVLWPSRRLLKSGLIICQPRAIMAPPCPR